MKETQADYAERHRLEAAASKAERISEVGPWIVAAGKRRDGTDED